MSIADEVLPPAPDDDDYSPEPTLEDRVQADLVRHTERIAADDRLIARAQARRIEHLLDLQDWSEQPQVASRLDGNPANIRLADDDAAHLTEDQARAAAYNRWDDREVARRTIVSETACLTRVAERTIDRQLDEARFLSSCAPATFAAFSRGEISYRHATTLLGQLLTLPDGDQAAFEEKVLPEAKRLPVGRFRDKARRLRERLHPESIVTRHKNALADRRSYWEAAPDGMGWLHWYGTAHDTKAAYDRINGMAVKLTHLGEPTPGGGTSTARVSLPVPPRPAWRDREPPAAPHSASAQAPRKSSRLAPSTNSAPTSPPPYCWTASPPTGWAPASAARSWSPCPCSLCWGWTRNPPPSKGTGRSPRRSHGRSPGTHRASPDC
ncbi:hypothetical protein RCH12_003658 [Cryobacterium sp. MP_3.1]|uniref:DUF222 domain-containing protein n=1 Tax=Cryobacterium sp. MP_3.1 TaxID=3071711 RepID=UPI002E05A2C0|nr:hypothetical protein [Cryobacterium sp. MP_3.1]